MKSYHCGDAVIGKPNDIQRQKLLLQWLYRVYQILAENQCER